MLKFLGELIKEGEGLDGFKGDFSNFLLLEVFYFWVDIKKCVLPALLKMSSEHSWAKNYLE